MKRPRGRDWAPASAGATISLSSTISSTGLAGGSNAPAPGLPSGDPAGVYKIGGQLVSDTIHHPKVAVYRANGERDVTAASA